MTPFAASMSTIWMPIAPRTGNAGPTAPRPQIVIKDGISTKPAPWAVDIMKVHSAMPACPANACPRHKRQASATMNSTPAAHCSAGRSSGSRKATAAATTAIEARWPQAIADKARQGRKPGMASPLQPWEQQEPAAGACW